MSRWTLAAPWLMGILAALALAAAVRAAELPAGAVACLGTLNLRHGHTVSALSFSADGKLLASASWDQTARVWDVGSGREVSRFSGHGDGASAVAISPDGRLAASGDMKRTVVLWDARTGKEIHRTADNQNTVFWLRFTADAKRLVWTSGKAVRIWDVGAWREERAIDVGDGVRPVVLSPDGRTLAVGCASGEIQIRSLADGALVATLGGHSKAVFSLAFSPDGARLLSGGADRTVRLWDVAAAREVRRVELPEHWVRPVAFINGGRQFAAAGQDGSIGVWDTESGREAGKFVATGREDAWVIAMAATADGKVLASAGTEFAIRLWDAETLQPLDSAGHTQELTSAVFSASGKTVVTASQDGSLRLWDSQSGRGLGRLGAGARGEVHLSASRGGRRLAIRAQDQKIRLCDFDESADFSKAALRTLELAGSAPGANSLALSPDGALVAALCGHAALRVLDTRSGEVRFTRAIDPRQWSEIPLAFSPDEHYLAIGSGDPDKKYVTLVDANSGREEARLPVPSAGDNSIAFSPDGAMLAVACRSQAIQLVEIASRNVRAMLKGDGDAGTCVAFSPDGRMLAAGGGPDRPTVRVWDLRSGRQIRKFVGHAGWLKSVAFSPDSKRLVSASRDTTAIVWDFARGHDDDETPSKQEIDAAALANAWTEMADDDAGKAYQAMQQLSRGGGEAAVEFLAVKLAPTAPVADERVGALIKALDADGFAERESARKALAELGEAATPALQKALRETQSAEVRNRVEVLLTELRQVQAGGQTIRELRAVEVLQNIGTERAVEVLERIATARSGSLAATRAADAAQRLKQHP
jgi:WD40 repeat protein